MLVRNSTRARCSAWFVAPQALADLLTFAPSKQYGPLELMLLRGFYRNTSSKTPSGGIFAEFSLHKVLSRPCLPARADALCARKTPARSPLSRDLAQTFCRPPLGSAFAHYARASYAIPTRRRQRSFFVFSHFLSRIYASAFALICVIFLL